MVNTPSLFSTMASSMEAALLLNPFGLIFIQLLIIISSVLLLPSISPTLDGQIKSRATSSYNDFRAWVSSATESIRARCTNTLRRILCILKAIYYIGIGLFCLVVVTIITFVGITRVLYFLFNCTKAIFTVIDGPSPSPWISVRRIWSIGCTATVAAFFLFGFHQAICPSLCAVLSVYTTVRRVMAVVAFLSSSSSTLFSIGQGIVAISRPGGTVVCCWLWLVCNPVVYDIPELGFHFFSSAAPGAMVAALS